MAIGLERGVVLSLEWVRSAQMEKRIGRATLYGDTIRIEGVKILRFVKKMKKVGFEVC